MLGTNARAARLERGLTIRALAHMASLSPSVVAELESGRIKDPRVSTLYAIAVALGIRMEDLMGVQRVEATTKGRREEARRKTL